MLLRPSAQRLQRHVQGAPERGQLVLDPGRHLRVLAPRDDPVPLQVPQCLGEHLRTDSLDHRTQVAEAQAVATPERGTVSPDAVAERLAADTQHQIKAVHIVQNETATGTRHPVTEVRAAINRARHPALYCVDTISSLASYDFRMDEWGVDLVIGGS